MASGVTHGSLEGSCGLASVSAQRRIKCGNYEDYNANYKHTYTYCTEAEEGWTDGGEWKQSEADQEKLFLVIKDEVADGIQGEPLSVGR